MLMNVGGVIVEEKILYLKDIKATNYVANTNIEELNSEKNGFDIPVREACIILNKKGYHTYWSSANSEDFRDNVGIMIKGLNVAYILIDPSNLSDNLKAELLINGKCFLWDGAIPHNDNGKYYGIYCPIQSLNMTCSEVSDNLSAKANKLNSIV